MPHGNPHLIYPQNRISPPSNLQPLQKNGLPASRPIRPNSPIRPTFVARPLFKPPSHPTPDFIAFSRVCPSNYLSHQPPNLIDVFRVCPQKFLHKTS